MAEITRDNIKVFMTSDYFINAVFEPHPGFPKTISDSSLCWCQETDEKDKKYT